MPTEILVGSCLCGAVRYEIHAAIEIICHCHCNMCQKAHGAAFGTYAPVPRSDFQFAQGMSTVGIYKSSALARRLFCSACGSTLMWDNETEFPDTVFVAASTLDSSIEPPAQRHIHVSSRVPWYEVTDQWPQSELY